MVNVQLLFEPGTNFNAYYYVNSFFTLTEVQYGVSSKEWYFSISLDMIEFNYNRTNGELLMSFYTIPGLSPTHLYNLLILILC